MLPVPCFERARRFCRPYGTRFHLLAAYPGLTSWAIVFRRSATIRLVVFHSHLVTSNLAFNKKKADHGQGASGTATIGHDPHKLFVINILTSNPLGLKIL